MAARNALNAPVTAIIARSGTRLQAGPILLSRKSQRETHPICVVLAWQGFPHSINRVVGASADGSCGVKPRLTFRAKRQPMLL